MGLRNSYRGIDEYAARTVRCTARWMVGRGGFTREDVEDLEQELMTDLLQRLTRFDPARAGRQTFIARVVENHAAKLLAARNTTRRAWTRDAVPLDDEPERNGGDRDRRCRAPLADDADRRAGATARRNPFEQVDLRVDVEVVVAGLPPALRAIGERLRTESLSDVARSLGVPRTTLYHHVALLRRRFTDAGYGENDGRVRRPGRGAGR